VKASAPLGATAGAVSDAAATAAGVAGALTIVSPSTDGGEQFAVHVDGGPGGVTTAGAVQPVWAGFVRAMPWLVSHSYPALPSCGPGSWPGGFLLSALPTQPAHGLPTASPFPLPLPDGEPSRVLS